MIDRIDDRLSTWVETVLGGIKPSFAPPADTDGSLSVNLYLLEIVDDPLRRNTSRPPLQPSLRYLVTTYATDVKDAHRLLGTLVTAALASDGFETEFDPIPRNIWSAFKIAPRPSFILRVPLPHEWPDTGIPLVTEGAAMQSVPMVPFFGRILGPQDVPLANSRIEIPNLYRYAYTDNRGNFMLNGVPAAPRPKTLIIRSRRRERTITVIETGAEHTPVIIRIDLLKN